MGDLSIPVVVLTLVGAALQGAAFLLTFVAAVRAWSHTAEHFKKGLVIASLMLLLDLPNRVVSALYTDMSQLLPMLPTQDNPAAAMTGVLTGAVLTLGLNGIMVPVSLRAGGPRHPYPLLYGQPDARSGWALALVGGTLFGVVSTAVFHLLGVELGSLLDFATSLTPDLDRDAGWFKWGVLLPAVCAAAVGEELLFRGVVQRWLSRWLGGTDRAGWIAIVATAPSCAILHGANTTTPGIKVLQIFVIGLFFGWLARRHGVESAILGHVFLNLSATALELSVWG